LEKKARNPGLYLAGAGIQIPVTAVDIFAFIQNSRIMRIRIDLETICKPILQIVFKY